MTNIITVARIPMENIEDGINEEKLCSICCENLINGKKIIHTSCEHEFHDKCLKEWLKNKDTCPNCRQIIHFEKKGHKIDYLEFCKSMCQCLFNIAVFFIIIYIGKLFIYSFCRGSCNESKNDTEYEGNCRCIKYSKRPNYWTNFNYIVGEFFIGLFGSLIIISCCCLRYSNNNN